MTFKDPIKNKEWKQNWFQENKERLSLKIKKDKKENPEKWTKYRKEDRIKVKTEVLSHYSQGTKPQCGCCGETQLEFLTLDHPNNDGNSQRRNGLPSGSNLYARLKALKFPQGFDVMCFNCNCGRVLNDGICPHKTLKIVKLNN